MLPWFCVPAMSIKKTCQNLLFVVNIYYSLLLFVSWLEKFVSFITTTFLNALDKKRYQDNTSLSTYLDNGHWGRQFWKIFKIDTYPNPGSSQGNPSSKLFWLEIFWVDDTQFWTHHKESAKTNKNQSIVTKKLNLKFRR